MEKRSKILKILIIIIIFIIVILYLIISNKNYSNSQKIQDVGDILESANKVHKYIEQNGYEYSLNIADLPVNIEQVKNVKNVCCATYVSWVLYETGYNWIAECTDINSCRDLLSCIEDKAKPKIKKIMNPTFNSLKPGDILFYGANGAEHTDIYAGEGLWYNCGWYGMTQETSPRQQEFRNDSYCIIRFAP